MKNNLLLKNLLMFLLITGCYPLFKQGSTESGSALNGSITKESPLPPLAIAIRKKALELRLRQKDPRSMSPPEGSENDHLPSYVKDLILREVAGQKPKLTAPQDRPCFVDPKLKQPKDIFYALQRAAFGTTKSSPNEAPAMDQGIALSPNLSGLKWSQFVGYELETWKLLDQIELWLTQLKPDSLDEGSRRSLGLTKVPIPEQFRAFVRGNMVRNDLDLVVDHMGRERTELRCFLAHQVTSIDSTSWEDAATELQEIKSAFQDFNVFENVSDVQFGLLFQESDLDQVNTILRAKEGIKGIGLDIKWTDNESSPLAFDPKLIGSKLEAPIRNRLRRLYVRYGYWRHLPVDFFFSNFPNVSQLLFRLDVSTSLTPKDYQKVASILEYLPRTKIEELHFTKFDHPTAILNNLKKPITTIKKLSFSQDNSSVSLDLADVARVFPQATNIVIQKIPVIMSREKLDSLFKSGASVAWQKILLSECKPGNATDRNLNFIHPIFSDLNFKVTKFDCREGLTVEQAPTLDDIQNKLLHKLIINHDQTGSRCATR